MKRIVQEFEATKQEAIETDVVTEIYRTDIESSLRVGRTQNYLSYLLFWRVGIYYDYRKKALTCKVTGWLEAGEARCKPVPLDRNVRAY